MFSRNFKFAPTNQFKNNIYLFLRNTCLAAGMVAVLLMGLWICGALSDPKHHHHNFLAQVRQQVKESGEAQALPVVTYPLTAELCQSQVSGIKDEPMVGVQLDHTAFEDINCSRMCYFEPHTAGMFSLIILKGTGEGLKEPASNMLSQTVAKVFFGDVEPSADR